MAKVIGSECYYMVNPGEYLKSDYGFTMQKDSPLREIFDFHIRCKFLQGSKSSFYSLSSQKHKNSIKMSVCFYMFGFYTSKSCP